MQTISLDARGHQIDECVTQFDRIGGDEPVVSVDALAESGLLGANRTIGSADRTTSSTRHSEPVSALGFASWA